MNELNHTIEVIDLTTAGSKTIDQFTGMIHWVDTVDSSGAQDLSGKVTVKLGQIKREAIPFRINSKLSGVIARELTITWEAQAGLTATFLLTPDDDMLDVQSPPSGQLILGASASSAAGAQVDLLLVAKEVVAANAGRKKVTIQNMGTVEVSIGYDNTVTVAGGAVLAKSSDGVAPGGSYSTENYTGAFWAISGTTGMDIRVLEEG